MIYENEQRTSPLRRPIAWVLLALAVLGFVSLSTKEYRLALFGVQTVGTVIAVEVIQTSTGSKWDRSTGKRSSRGGDSTFMTMQFTTPDGQLQQVKTLATFHTVARVGDQHPMIYLPSKPANAKIYSAKQLWLPMLIGTIFSTACLLGGLILFRVRPAVRIQPDML